MAITNAQQAKQIMNEGGPMRKIKGQDHMLAYITPSEKDILVELGGQETMTPEGILAYPPEGNYGSEAKGPGSGPGPSGITGMASTGGANFSSGNNVASGGTGQVSNPTTRIGGKDYDVVDTNVKERQEAQELADARAKEKKDKFITTNNTPDYVPGYVKFLAGLNNTPNRKFFYDKVVAAGKIPGLNYGEEELEQAYQDYMDNRMAGKTDAYGNPTQGFSYDIDGTGKYDLTGNFIDNRDDGAGQKNLPEDTMGDTEEDEVNPRDYTGLAPRFMGSIFDFTGLAEGGRVAAQQGGIMSQQGGSIMPRLNDLSGDVSSAEQMLQEINQRLESAESTLGEGGGMRGTTIAPNMSPLENAMRSQQPLGSYDQLRQMPIGQPGLASIANYTPFGGETVGIPEQYKAGFDEFKKGKRMMGGQAISYSMLPDGNRVMFGDTGSAGVFGDYLKSIGAMPDNPFGPRQIAPNMTGQVTSLPGGAMQSPLQQAAGLANGGRAGMMDGGMMEDTPEGGIMDLESGRQMYFLGKLVKKAGRAIKKVVKSPIGKAALLYFGGNALMGAGGGKGLGSFFGKGSFNPFLKKVAGDTAFSKLGNIASKFGMVDSKGAMTLGGKLGLSFGVPFALDALGVGKEEDDKMDLDEYYKTQGIDIDAIRNNPNRFLARRFMAEGGDAEPVAKKTMPLLDMDGQEMDLRAEGGFVPLGRMERADDVPARLSKNEFVFTADAVRNAGEGDIDKGAEVMYNMMKNLESGGEVSEESQGLDGAREMFQTSQRLEEVL